MLLIYIWTDRIADNIKKSIDSFGHFFEKAASEFTIIETDVLEEPESYGWSYCPPLQ